MDDEETRLGAALFAMLGLLTRTGNYPPNAVATTAWDYADAFIEEKKRRDEQKEKQVQA